MSAHPSQRESPGEPSLPVDSQPDSPTTKEDSFDARSVMLAGLLILASLAVLHFGRSFFIPIVAALLMSFTLMPIIDGLERRHIPRLPSALLIVCALVGGLLFGVQVLYEPAKEWATNLPELTAEVESKLRSLRGPIERVEEATQAVEELGSGGRRGQQEVRLQKPATLPMLAAHTGIVAGNGLVIFALLFFLLTAGDTFLRRVVEVLPRFRDKRRAVEIARAIQRDVSRFLFTITIINLLLGVSVAMLMWVLGMPNPLLWGAMATLLNFVPFIGPFVGTLVIAAVALLTFDPLFQALLPPFCFLVVTGLEGLLITPAAIGHRLTLNPVFVFIALLAGTSLWGVPGALLAVPLLAVLKIVLDRFERVAWIGTLMERSRGQ